jgi:uncharacterized cupredoxin-like copper-binding protein
MTSIVHWIGQMNYAWKKEGSMKQLRAFIFCLLLLSLASLLGACGEKNGDSGSTTKTPTTTAPTTTPNTPTTTAPQEVHVTMGEMYVKSTITTFKVGQPYKIIVMNEGTVIHEFVIAPVRQGSESHEDLDAVALLHEDDLDAGQSRAVNFTFKQSAPAGKLEFECSYPGHYEQGMHTPIVVE